ncbi:MAG: SpoIIE family protein phosphatase [Actinomycetota bacterium]|nr:SpoIIE family protein phosphatase [Actinomycetota bacterium]
MPDDREDVSPFSGDGEMAQRMRAFDWTATPIGPVAGWPPSLCTAVGIMLESRHPMLIWWGPEFTMFYNDAFVPLAGVKHPVGLGQHGWEMFADIWPTIGPMLTGVLSTGVATWVDDQLLMTNRHGLVEETYWTYSYSPIRDERGQVRGVFTATNDTTDRVLGERRLRTLRALGEVSVVNAVSGEEACATALAALSGSRADVPFALVYLLADDGASAQLVADYGIALDAAVVPPTLPQPEAGHWIWQAITSGQATVITGLSQRYPAGFRSARTDIGGAKPDAAVVTPLAVAGLDRPAGVLVSGISPYRPLDSEYRTFINLVAGHVATAVADARAYVAERRRAEALAELDRAKTEFFSNISHEFRTPLTLMMGPVAELRAAATVDEARLHAELDVIHRNGLRLGKLVNTLLDFSRLQAGRMQARYEPVDLGAFTAELASAFRSAIERAGLRFEVDWADLGEPVYLDREMWEKVVLNLLSNALKFTLDGRITVAVRRSGSTAVFTVADTGIGVPAEELPRLFDRFHRVCQARTRSTEGSGIGLALVRELVALHGGSITAESTPGVGTTFTVTLPLGSAHLPAAQLVEPTAITGVAEAAEPYVEEALRWLPTDGAQAGPPPDGQSFALPNVERPGTTQGRILVADDNADMREYLQRLLGDRYTVQAVSNGRAALEAARAQPPDLVVSDVMMPTLDGVALMGALRADERTARVPVLLLSARAGPEAAAEGLAAGADDYLIKPFSARELLARVRAHLELGGVRREAEQRLELLAQAAAALSAAVTPMQVVDVAIEWLGQLLGTPAVGVWELRKTSLEVMSFGGWNAAVLAERASFPLDAATPACDAARRRMPVWVERVEDWQRNYPHLVETSRAYGYVSGAALPLLTADSCLGVMVIEFPEERVLDPGDRAMASTLVGHCAQALVRARLLQTEHDIAYTLQHSLLPDALPPVARLALAQRYLPGAAGTQAGGDWYDVVALDGTSVAIVVGDVVGKGPAAAAVMGKLSSALTGYLLEGHGPAAALECLDRFAVRVPGALATTVACLILDWETGEARWSRAGHPPPLLLERGQARYLPDGLGAPLGVRRRRPFTEGNARISPGGCLLMFTDGLIERRGEPLDDGMDRLASCAEQLSQHEPDALLAQLLPGILDDAAPADDIAVVAARLIPAPLAQRLPAIPTHLPRVRRALRAWAAAAGLPDDLTADVQVAFGEAAANAVEHAYPAEAPGEFDYHIARHPDGAIEVRVRDYGRWRPPPADPGHRGRGLQLICGVATDIVLKPGQDGTEISFWLPPPPPA